MWLWTAIAHGAELLDTYRYRQPLSGSEQYHAGLMALDGTTLTQGGADFVTVAQEIERFAGHLDAPAAVSQPKAAILMDWDSLTALKIHPQSQRFDARSTHKKFYGGLKQLGLDVDFLHSPSASELARYKVVCSGLFDLIDSDHLTDWITYVEQGGHLIITPRTATRDTHGHFPQVRYGDRLKALTGATITGCDSLPTGHAGTIRLTPTGEEIRWHRWAEQYQTDRSTTPLAQFTDQFYAGAVAAFTRRKANGNVTCIGFDQQEGIEKLIAAVLPQQIAGISPLPENTLFRIRGALGIFLNYNDTGVEIPPHLYKHAEIVLGSHQVEPASVTLMQYKDCQATRPVNTRRLS